jgi:hypothetical protein
VKQRQWDSASCAVHSDAEARLLLPAMVEAGAARFRVHEVTREELGPVDTGAEDLLANWTLVAIDTRYDAPTGSGGIWLDPRAGWHQVYDSGDIARATGEPLPAAHTKTRTTPSTGEYSVSLWAVVTLGVSLLFDSRVTTYTETATDATPVRWEQIASHAVAMWNALSKSFPHQAIFMFPRGALSRLVLTVGIESASGCYNQIKYAVPIELGWDAWAYLAKAEWVRIMTMSGVDVTRDR